MRLSIQYAIVGPILAKRTLAQWRSQGSEGRGDTDTKPRNTIAPIYRFRSLRICANPPTTDPSQNEGSGPPVPHRGYANDAKPTTSSGLSKTSYASKTKGGQKSNFANNNTECDLKVKQENSRFSFWPGGLRLGGTIAQEWAYDIYHTILFVIGLLKITL